MSNLTITIARKPLEGTVAKNALKWGTGGLNIDESRVAGPPWSWGTQTDIRGNGFGSKRPSDGDVYARNVMSVAAGRWPANALFIHKAGCRKVGTKQVQGTGHYPAARPAGSDVAGPSGHPGQTGLQERYLLQETVSAWECADGCPVAELDRQSGLLQSGGKAGSLYGRQQEPVACYGKGLNWGTSPAISDSGGASRFFKQVSCVKDEE